MYCHNKAPEAPIMLCNPNAVIADYVVADYIKKEKPRRIRDGLTGNACYNGSN